MTNNFKSPKWTQQEIDTLAEIAKTSATQAEAIERACNTLTRSRDAVRKKLRSLQSDEKSPLVNALIALGLVDASKAAKVFGSFETSPQLVATATKLLLEKELTTIPLLAARFNMTEQALEKKLYETLD